MGVKGTIKGAEILAKRGAKAIDALVDTLKAKYKLKTLHLFETNAGDIKLESIIVDKDSRKQGVGTAVMKEINDYADASGKRVVLTPAVKDDYQGTTSRSRLVDFYKRSGYVENKGKNKDYAISAGMYRNPVAKRGKKAAVDSLQKLGELLGGTQAERMARAAEQGYDVTRPVYHGTATDFAAFDPERAIGTNYWSTTDKASIEAGEVGAQGKGVIKEMYHRIRNPAGWAEYDKYTTDELIARGYDGLALPDRDGHITYSAFEPNQYRSVDADFNPANADSPNLLASLSGAAPYLAGGAVAAGALAPEEAEAGIITKGGKRLIEAWHGSPHSFDKFDISKIGTGEGAQAYGHGLYFADAKDTALDYRNKLSDYRTRLDGVEVNPLQAEPDFLMRQFADIPEADAEALSSIIQDVYVDPRKRGITGARQDAEEIRSYYQDALNTVRPDQRQTALRKIAEQDEKIRVLTEYEGRISDAQGGLYRTHIDVEPDTLLDWDKPLSEQSEAVKSALKNSGYLPSDEAIRLADSETVAAWDKYQSERAAKGYKHADTQAAEAAWSDARIRQEELTRPYNRTGDETLQKLFHQSRSELGGVGGATEYSRNVSEKLKQQGIPGIRYLDGVSRNAGEGSYNYVMFDDAPISIVERGNAKPAALAATAVGTGAGIAIAPEVAQAYNDYIRDEMEAQTAADTFLQMRGQKAGFWEARRQDLLDMVGGIGGFAENVALPAIDKPLQGYLALAGVGGALAQGQGFDQAIAQGAQIARQPSEQTTYNMGGAVTDAVSPYVSPEAAAAAGALVHTGIQMGSPF